MAINRNLIANWIRSVH